MSTVRCSYHLFSIPVPKAQALLGCWLIFMDRGESSRSNRCSWSRSLAPLWRKSLRIRVSEREHVSDAPSATYPTDDTLPPSYAKLCVVPERSPPSFSLFLDSIVEDQIASYPKESSRHPEQRVLRPRSSSLKDNPNGDVTTHLGILAHLWDRFLPQYDSEVQGTNPAIQTPFPAPLRISSCSTCKLIWLQGLLDGSDTPGPVHPIHHSGYDTNGHSSRSLFVFVAGACTPTHLGFGVFFHPDSELNLSRRLSISDKGEEATQQQPQDIRTDQRRAEIEAALQALHIVRQQVVSKRIHMLEEAALTNKWSDQELCVLARFRLIISTTSAYLVDTICSLNCLSVVQDPDREVGQGIQLWDELLSVIDEMVQLAQLGIQVVWYYGQREESLLASELANGALDRSFDGETGQGLVEVCQEVSETGQA